MNRIDPAAIPFLIICLLPLAIWAGRGLWIFSWYVRHVIAERRYQRDLRQAHRIAHYLRTRRRFTRSRLDLDPRWE